MSIPEIYNLFLESSGVTTDSRKITTGTIFFALKGENFDGNRFAEQALQDGATYAIIDDDKLPVNDRLILVEDVLTTLQKLANFHRKQFDIPFLAITGSNGKTTTKELLGEILSQHYKTHFTKGNLNNHIGVPITLLSIGAGTDIAIIEMGANHQGEIKALCEIAEPTHGLITNIGKAHLEGFGGIEGVKKGKSELYDFLADHKGVAFVNLDELFLNELSKKVDHRVFYYRSDTPNKKVAPFETSLIKEEPVLSVAFLSDNRGELIKAQSNLYGIYNFNNLQTAISVGRYFKVPHQKIKTSIEAYISENNRSQMIEQNSNTYLMDAYNANPTSIRFAIDNLDSKEAVQKMAILGDMLELGEYSSKEHRAIIDHAKSKSFGQVILVGPEFGKVLEDGDNCLHFQHVDELKVWYKEQSFTNYVILLKGSRGMKLEQLLS